MRSGTIGVMVYAINWGTVWLLKVQRLRINSREQMSFVSVVFGFDFRLVNLLVLIIIIIKNIINPIVINNGTSWGPLKSWGRFQLSGGNILSVNVTFYWINLVYIHIFNKSIVWICVVNLVIYYEIKTIFIEFYKVPPNSRLYEVRQLIASRFENVHWLDLCEVSYCCCRCC